MLEKITYQIYKITNIKNNMIYVGAHACKKECLNNNDKCKYLGSGKELKKVIKEEGIENFKKEILFEFTDKEKMFEKEKEIVDEEFINRNDTYNVKKVELVCRC